MYVVHNKDAHYKLKPQITNRYTKFTCLLTVFVGMK